MDTTTMNKGLGWFSLALGAAELFAPGKIATLVGAPGRSAIVRAFGARELAAGAGIFHSPNTAAPVWGRVAGDVLDLAALAALAGPGNPRRHLALAALAFVAGAPLIDRSAERRVGKECVSTCRSRGSPDHKNTK